MRMSCAGCAGGSHRLAGPPAASWLARAPAEEDLDDWEIETIPCAPPPDSLSGVSQAVTRPDTPVARAAHRSHARPALGPTVRARALLSSVPLRSSPPFVALLAGLTCALLLAVSQRAEVGVRARVAFRDTPATAETTLDDAVTEAQFGPAARARSRALAQVTEAAGQPTGGLSVSLKHLVLLFHASSEVRPIYEHTLQRRVAGAELYLVNSPYGVFSHAYQQLMVALRSRYQTSYLDAAARHAGANPLGSYDTITVASFSAGYAAVRLMLDEPTSAERIDAVVAIDSWHGRFDTDGTARDSQLRGLVSFARRAMTGPRICWYGHTDVSVPKRGDNVFASTSEIATELRRLTGLSLYGDDVSVGGWRIASVDLHADDHAEHVAALTVWGDDWLADAIATLIERRAR